MDVLIVLLVAGILFYTGSKRSRKAKAERARRLAAQEEEAKRTPQPKAAKQKPAAASKAQKASAQGETRAKTAQPAAKKAKAAQPAAKKAKAAQTAAKGSAAPQPAEKNSKAAQQPKAQKPVQQKKSPKASPASQRPDIAMEQSTLIEQRPDREQRGAHTKVQASVKPLKNAYENDEHCEHRIELNPEIQYSGQKHAEGIIPKVQVRTDGESLVQGIIWAEILGRPKAHQRMQPRFPR